MQWWLKVHPIELVWSKCWLSNAVMQWLDAQELGAAIKHSNRVKIGDWISELGQDLTAGRCAGRVYNIFKFSWEVEAVVGRQASKSIRKGRCSSFCSSYTIYIRKPSKIQFLQTQSVIKVSDHSLFQADTPKILCRDLVEDTSRVLGWHPEQDRVFKIILNHATEGYSQLT